MEEFVGQVRVPGVLCIYPVIRATLFAFFDRKYQKCHDARESENYSVGTDVKWHEKLAGARPGKETNADCIYFAHESSQQFLLVYCRVISILDDTGQTMGVSRSGMEGGGRVKQRGLAKSLHWRFNAPRCSNL